MPLSQPGIFNALDHGLTAGTGASASLNQAALQTTISLCQAAGGGTVLIPSQDLDGNTVYPIIGPIDVGEPLSGSAEAVIIEGTAQGQEGGPTLLVKGDGTLFSVDTTSGHIGGITFRDFGIQYDKNPDTDVVYSGTAIDVVKGENVRIERVVFYDCAQAVFFEDALQCTMFECTAQNDDIVASPACVSIGNDVNGVLAKEIYIAGCIFLSTANGGVGLAIEGSEHVRVINTRIDGFYQGIVIAPGAALSGGHNAIRHNYTNVTVYAGGPSAGPALTIQPAGPQHISEIVFAECIFEPGETATPGGPGVYIDQGESDVENIRFVACQSVRWAGPGIEIVSGSYIEIIGGIYASNASGASPSGGSGGISVTGPAANIRILGVASVGTFPYFVNSGGPQPLPTQDVGIYIGSGTNIIIDHCDLTENVNYAVLIDELGGGAAAPAEIFIRNCNVSGYGSSPGDGISVVTTASNVQVTNCAGYNDLAAPLATTPHASPFSGVTYGYYGPVTVYGAGSTELIVTLAGSSTGMGNGTFVLGPGQDLSYAIGLGGHSWTIFLVIGQ